MPCPSHYTSWPGLQCAVIQDVPQTCGTTPLRTELILCKQTSSLKNQPDTQQNL